MRHLPSRSDLKKSPRNNKSYLLLLPCTKTHRHGQDVVLVKHQSCTINPIVVLKNHLTTGWSSHNRKANFRNKDATAWLPTYNETLFPFRSRVSYRTSSKPWADGLRIPFTDTGVRLMKLPSTTFGTYQQVQNDVSKATRSDLGG